MNANKDPTQQMESDPSKQEDSPQSLVPRTYDCTDCTTLTQTALYAVYASRRCLMNTLLKNAPLWCSFTNGSPRLVCRFVGLCE